MKKALKKKKKTWLEQFINEKGYPCNLHNLVLNSMKKNCRFMYICEKLRFINWHNMQIHTIKTESFHLTGYLCDHCFAENFWKSHDTQSVPLPSRQSPLVMLQSPQSWPVWVPANIKKKYKIEANPAAINFKLVLKSTCIYTFIQRNEWGNQYYNNIGLLCK